MDRLIRAGIAPDLVIKTISELRRDWGSDAPYICKIDRKLRDKAIAESLSSGGLSDLEIAKKVGCSARTIRRRRSEWSI